MKRIFSCALFKILILFSLSLGAQPAPPSSPPPSPTPPSSPPVQPAPTPAPAPPTSPTPSSPSAQPSSLSPAPSPSPPPSSSSKTDIPVISIGDQVKPMGTEKPKTSEGNTKKQARKAMATPKVSKVENNLPLLLESKQLVHSRLSQIGDEMTFVVAENYPKANPLLPKGTLVLGKISAMERMQKDQPAGIRISLETVLSPTGNAIPLTGTLEVLRQKGQDNFGGKEIFIPVGFKQGANLTKKFSSRVLPRPSKLKTPKGLLSAPAQIENGLITIKLGELRYPTRIEGVVEAPQGMEVTDLKEDSVKIIRVNDFFLPRPIMPLEEKIKIADRNKNKVKDMGYKFPGWEFIRFLPEGNSTVVFSAQTKDGKPVEIIANVKTEYK